LRESKNETYVI